MLDSYWLKRTTEDSDTHAMHYVLTEKFTIAQVVISVVTWHTFEAVNG